MRDEGGFTLVELLVAIFLFGLVMVALTGVLISTTQSIGATAVTISKFLP